MTASPGPSHNRLSFHWAGRSGLLVEVGSSEEVSGLYAELRRRADTGQLPGVVDIVPAAKTVLVTARSDHGVLVDLAASLATWRVKHATTTSTGTVEVPVTYDGDDLDTVAHAAGLSPDETVALHTSATYRVAFCGFAPGFAYLEGVPEALRVPRLSRPRQAVPAGAVGLAGPYCGIYPRRSPGGWQLIGRTDVVVFNPDRDPPALLTPGMQVRFASRGRPFGQAGGAEG